MPKRKRPSQPDRPPPPPPPPKSLVSLLKSDKKVLQYFTLLQANLEADTQKWKGRAGEYQKECEELTKKLASGRTGSNTRNVKSNAAKKPDKNRAPIEKKKQPLKKVATPIKESSAPTIEGKEIDDDMFDTMFDGLSSDDEDDEFNINLKPAAKETPATQPSSNEDGAAHFSIFDDDERVATKEAPGANHPFRDIYQDRLREARDNLSQLGVSLVDEEGARRPDEDVLADLSYALRAVTRVPSRQNKELEPFLDMIPACDRKEHPACKAKQCAFTALRLMDLFSADLQSGAWDTLTRDDELRVGVCNRESLVTSFMSSLAGEICDSWPIADRSSRIQTTAVHYNSSDNYDKDEGFNVNNKAEFGAKSQARLSTIVERSLLVQLLIHYYDHRGQAEEQILLLIRYIMSTAPSLTVEEYPKYPPALSICIVEAMLTKSVELIPNGKTEFSDVEEGFIEALQGTALAVHVSAAIWKQRLQSNDDRITDIARVNLASYERIVKLNLDWFGEPLACDSLDEIPEVCKGHKAYNKDACAPIFAILHGAAIQRLSMFASSPSSVTLANAVRCSVARRQIEIRQLDRYRHRIGTPTELDEFEEQRIFLNKFENMKGLTKESLGGLFWEYVSAFARCCLDLSDGEAAMKLAHRFVSSEHSTEFSEVAHEAFGSIAQLSRTPLIRFINLKRRADRRNAFQSQAKIEKVLLVEGIVKFEAEAGDASYYWGDHAFDGASANFFDDSRILDYVATHWRPSDLKAFDRDAPSGDDLVKTSTSERACALSHISTWEGVRRSLQPLSNSEVSMSPLHSKQVLRLFRISGFASGKALLSGNEDMPPSPVCVVMEDDAILVDRFTDRLEELLRELPRDFHFCSLGYSRPKTAPVVPYSSQVGIPSCIWYLTGYVMSFEGAKYLQRKLPVRGPVDSWIGMQMCSNWENEYGQEIGVGMQSRPAAVLPSRKDLEQILKFRSFCALTPLCSQRVNASSTASARRTWRQRDTDIVYSGHPLG
jgi:hypothetical protein